MMLIFVLMIYHLWWVTPHISRCYRKQSLLTFCFGYRQEKHVARNCDMLQRLTRLSVDTMPSTRSRSLCTRCRWWMGQHWGTLDLENYNRWVLSLLCTWCCIIRCPTGHWHTIISLIFNPKKKNDKGKKKPLSFLQFCSLHLLRVILSVVRLVQLNHKKTSSH